MEIKALNPEALNPDSRWFTGSGILGEVTLTVEDPVHLTEGGVFFSTVRADDGEAEYRIITEIANDTDKDCRAEVRHLLFCKDSHKAVSDIVEKLEIKAGQTVSCISFGKLKSPELWSVDSPYLYELKTFLIYDEAQNQNGALRMNLVSSIKTGIRTYYFYPDEGFFLNSRPLKLKGVCVHHDLGCLGGIAVDAAWERRLAKLREMGCNAIRMSHNPHCPGLYDLCDRMGFLVMDEAFDEWEAPKNKWWHGHNVYPPKHQGYYTAFHAWHKADLTDMIRHNRNHPSIIMWSIGNEIDYPNDPYCHPSFESMTGNNDSNKPEAEKIYNPLRPDASRLRTIAEKLCAIVREADDTRPVTQAIAFPELSANLGIFELLDVVGFNYKEHLYDENHKRFADKPILGSENGHLYSQWRTVTDLSYISGQFIWTGIDNLGEASGWPVHGSGAGLLTLAGFEKPGFYRRQSFWSDSPMVHLVTVREDLCRSTPWGDYFEDAIDNEFADAGEFWDYAPGENVVVKCYTNLPAVEFFLNSKSLGIHKREPGHDCILLNVRYEPGRLSAAGVTGSGDGQQVIHSIESTGSASNIRLSEYVPDNIICESDRRIKQIEVTVTDAYGRRIYTDSTLVRVKVINGKLLGIENGDLADVTEYSLPQRRAFRGQLLIYVCRNDENEPMRVEASADMLPKSVIEI